MAQNGIAWPDGRRSAIEHRSDAWRQGSRCGSQDGAGNRPVGKDIGGPPAGDGSDTRAGKPDRHGRLLQRDGDAGRLGDLDHRAGEAAAGEVAQAPHADPRLDQPKDRSAERRTIALDRHLEAQVVPRRHHRDAVTADVAADQHRIVRAHRLRADRCWRDDGADAGGVDEHPVGLSAVHHLGVASDEAYAAGRGGVAHGREDATQQAQRQTLLQDQSDAHVESLIVPFTASEPMSPPGNISGRMT